MEKNRKRRIKTPILVVLITAFFTWLLYAAKVEDALDNFNPQNYESSEIKYRDPAANKPMFASVNPIIEARNYLVLGYMPEAIKCYKALDKNTFCDKMKKEYAYALAVSGYYEPAMLYLDAAHAENPAGPAPYYYAAWVFTFAGYGDIAGNFWKISRGDNDFFSKPASDSIRNKNIGALSYTRMDRDFIKELDYPESQGVVVLTVYPGPVQFSSELAPRDIIMKADGKTTGDAGELADIINSKSPGSRIDLIVWRKGEKRNFSVKVNSNDEISGMAEPKKPGMQPPEKAKSRLSRALSLFLDKKYFTSILIYRQLIEDYPDWLLPYLGYLMALEKAGAFICTQKAVEQALKAAEDNKEAKDQLKDKLKQLKSVPQAEQNKWRQAQTVMSLAETPPVFYLGFGGGRMIFSGGSLKALISARLGIINATNTDFSINLDLDTSSGAGIGLSMSQRFPLNDMFGFNTGLTTGLTMSYNTAGSSFLIGAAGGLSMSMDSGKTSYDFVLSVPSIITFISSPSVSIYLGYTVYL